MSNIRGEERFLVDNDITVAEILERWPQTQSVFQLRKLACVGCPVARFDTLVDVSRIYNIDLSQLRSELEAAIRVGNA